MSLITFAKTTVGMDLADYIINFIDQHIIAYSFLGNLDREVQSIKENDTTINYNIASISEADHDVLQNLRNKIKEEPIIKLYGINYYISIPENTDNDSFSIRIQQCS